MLRKLFWGFLAFAFPWLVLLIYDNPGGAIVALFMQATLFGWPPATMWAMRIIRENQQLAQKKKPR
ncbi:Uncharacterised protein [Legionella beliardensis]|uniref:YqaE/Pmp3 family membrane protein n=1 Tax=Legionella beliardensis TaxID=91822 RepID=A0A378HYP8_9GAMM|nr:hypothetical protein [Legionella beliardensis]STX27661.1 Uncharacterised protein [Legionella beliardensis]